MFGGIIQEKVRVVSAKGKLSVVEVTFAKPKKWKLEKGQSIAIDGICSTVVSPGGETFVVQYVPETLRLTTAKFFDEGRVVNLERSLKYGDFVDGHFVQGHVEGTGTVKSIATEKGSVELTVSVPKMLAPNIIRKGSIAFNGVSLTVVRVSYGNVTVALIPHTLSATNLGLLKEGDPVNIETDVLARHLAASFKSL
jgi:riboflavin synthase alpha subunit